MESGPAPRDLILSLERRPEDEVHFRTGRRSRASTRSPSSRRRHATWERSDVSAVHREPPRIARFGASRAGSLRGGDVGLRTLRTHQAIPPIPNSNSAAISAVDPELASVPAQISSYPAQGRRRITPGQSTAPSSDTLKGGHAPPRGGNFLGATRGREEASPGAACDTTTCASECHPTSENDRTPRRSSVRPGPGEPGGASRVEPHSSIDIRCRACPPLARGVPIGTPNRGE
jgi:hypothetical protein